MTLVDAVKKCFANYVVFTGRAPRSEYWWWMLFVVLTMMILSRVSIDIANIFSLAVLLPGIAVGARRLHDMGKSGWWQLISLIPILGWLVVLYWMVQPSEGDNAYGAAP